MRRIPSAPPVGGGPDMSQTAINDHAGSLAQLYASICHQIDLPDGSRRRSYAAYEQMIRQFIADSYDDTDPDERAERMPVALGARPRLVPARYA